MYDEGSRHSCPFFAAFCLKIAPAPEPGASAPGESCVPPSLTGPKIGFTVTRALGKAVIRNRLRRRLREAVRMHLAELPPTWWIVFNPRRAGLDAPLPDLEREVRRVFQRCASS